MDRLTANRYIALQQKIASSGGSVPQEIIDEVEALDTTVNGDETQDPPVVGLVDIVGDLESTVDDLDTTVNGDSTTTPETPGLVDRVADLELAVNGDPEAVPPVPPTVGNVSMSLLWTNSDPTQNFTAQNVSIGDQSGSSFIRVCAIYRLADSDMKTVVDIPYGNGNYVFLGVYTGSQRRKATISGTNLQFDDAKESSTTVNNYFIPLYIYSVKIL